MKFAKKIMLLVISFISLNSCASRNSYTQLIDESPKKSMNPFKKVKTTFKKWNANRKRAKARAVFLSKHDYAGQYNIDAALNKRVQGWISGVLNNPNF